MAAVLVAYATKLGSTREIAERIASVIGAAGFEAEAVSVRDVHSVEPYRAVVLGSALYAAHWQRDANRFVTRHRHALAERPLWLFSSGPLDPRLARQDLPMTPHAAEITAGLQILGHRTFGGRLLPDAAVDPQVLATHPIGDFRDWAAIERWAAGIAAALPGVLSRADGAQ
jgi:menaquinone-dependent protoporphyrinogen oxidase